MWLELFYQIRLQLLTNNLDPLCWLAVPRYIPISFDFNVPRSPPNFLVSFKLFFLSFFKLFSFSREFLLLLKALTITFENKSTIDENRGIVVKLQFTSR